jgi:hypothetical protein
MLNSEDEKKLKMLLKRLRLIMSETEVYGRVLVKREEHRALYHDFLLVCNNCLKIIKTAEIAPEELRKLVDGEYRRLLNIMKDLFFKVVLGSKQDFFSMERWNSKDPVTLFFANYFILNQHYRMLKERIAQFFVRSYKGACKLVVDDHSPLFDTSDCRFQELASDLSLTRDYARKLILDVQDKVGSIPLGVLEEQVSEIVKNAIKHGNRCNPDKKVRVWYSASREAFKVIVEDEGDGFTNLEEWNEFNANRLKAFSSGNMEEMMKYIQYKGPESTEDDGGNSLFAALEYWDSGLVYNSRKNKVSAIKYLY